jgi:hypothetical protein
MVVTQAYDLAGLIQRMMLSNPGLVESDILRVLSVFRATIERLCHEGAAINWEGFVRFSVAIGGEFKGQDDRFDRKRHQFRVNAAVSKTLNKRFRQQAQARRRHVAPPGPVLANVYDLATGSVDQMVTRGDIVTLKGWRLQFDRTDARDYLRFVDAENSSSWVAVTRFQRLVPSECVFVMPAVEFSTGYFELANSLRTSTTRTSQTTVLVVK